MVRHGKIGGARSCKPLRRHDVAARRGHRDAREANALPRRSGGATPFGPFRLRGIRLRVLQRRWRRDGWGSHTRSRRPQGARQGGHTGRHTETTVEVECCPGTGLTPIALMTVLMVTEVVRCRACFVLTIGADRGPTELDRHEDDKEDGKPATHGRDYSGNNALRWALAHRLKVRSRSRSCAPALSRSC